MARRASSQIRSVGPFDGSDDTLVGVYNNSGATVSTIGLTATTDIFGFDGDGICGLDHGSPYKWTGTGLNGLGYSGCPYDTTGYAGPYVTYSNFSSSNGYKTGNVNFLMPGGGGLHRSVDDVLQLGEQVKRGQLLGPDDDHHDIDHVHDVDHVDHVDLIDDVIDLHNVIDINDVNDHDDGAIDHVIDDVIDNHGADNDDDPVHANDDIVND